MFGDMAEAFTAALMRMKQIMSSRMWKLYGKFFRGERRR